MIFLLREGVNVRSAFAIFSVRDDIANKNRALASLGLGVEMALEGSFEAALDGVHRHVQLPHKRIAVLPLPLIQVTRELQGQKRQGYLDQRYLKAFSGMVCGMYSVNQSCRGDLAVTLHIGSKAGHT